MRICDKLGKFPHEVEELPCDEFDRLVIFYLWDTEENKKQAKKNSKKLDPSQFAQKK